MRHDSVLHVVYSGFAMLWLLNACFLLDAWCSLHGYLSSLLSSPSLRMAYFLFWANFWSKALRSRWAPPPSLQSSAPIKTHVPSPVEDCGVPSTKARVGQYQGMCALMDVGLYGWVDSWTYPVSWPTPILHICQRSHTVTVTEDRYFRRSKTKVIKWRTLVVCSECAQYAK